MSSAWVAPIHTAQPPYNLFEREIEKDVLPVLRMGRHRGSCIRLDLPRIVERPNDSRD